MPFVDSTRKAEVSGGSVVSVDLTLNSTVAGNLVVVGTTATRSGGPASDPTVTDGGNAWTKETSQWVDPKGIGVSWSILTTGGNRTINCSPNGVNSYDITAYAHEFAGPHASPKSGTNVLADGNSTTADTGAMTPADDDSLVVALESNVSSGTVTENVSPGDTDWTLSNESESATNASVSSMVFIILSGAPVSRRAAWTVPSSVWVTFIMAFKPVATAAPPQRTLMGVGR